MTSNNPREAALERQAATQLGPSLDVPLPGTPALAAPPAPHAPTDPAAPAAPAPQDGSDWITPVDPPAPATLPPILPAPLTPVWQTPIVQANVTLPGISSPFTTPSSGGIGGPSLVLPSSSPMDPGISAPAITPEPVWGDDFGPFQAAANSVAGTSLASTNWAGAVIPAATGEAFNAVSAQLTVPTVAGNAETAWVGLDGYGSSDVAQAGITAGADGESVAFDEWSPTSANDISPADFKVKPGDVVKITVSATGAGATKAEFLFNNLTTGQNYQDSLTAPSGTSLAGSSAEYIVEQDPSVIPMDKQIPGVLASSSIASSGQPSLSDFLGSGKTMFANATATYSDGSSASLSSALPTSNVLLGSYGHVSAASNTVAVNEHSVGSHWGGAA